MATVEMDTVGPEGDQKEKMLSSSEEGTPPVLNEITAPMNFCELTPSQFGISTQSFTPASSSNRKDKSRLAQIKARRRSTIGVRGSPETNSLIRFMAQQRMKTPPASQTPELVRSSPFLPRVPSILRQKMASFQSLMDVAESDACDPMPAQDSNTGGCIKTRDYLSDGNSCGGGKENNPPMTPTPSKRRRLGPLEGCNVEIREASTPILHSSVKEQEVDEQPATAFVTQGPLPSSETADQAVLISPTFHVNFELNTCSSTENHQGGVFELQSLSRPPPDDPAATSQPQRSSPFHIPSLPSLLEMKPTGDDDSTVTSTVKKKRVHFGGPLSPEFFDKNLPPSTPLQKGGTPARAATPGGSLHLRSVLKTPQTSESKTPQSQTDLISPTVFGASPTFAIPRNPRIQSEGEESEEKYGKIVFPSMEEIDSAVTSDTECMWGAQLLNLNTAFHEESLSQSLTESDTKPSATPQMDVLDEPSSLPENEKQPETDVEGPGPARSSNKRKKPEPEEEPISEAPARSSSRKRKQPKESEPVKRSTRSAAKSASGKMKMTTAAARKWNKEVDRSLYGSREYISKNPTLSPITERLSLGQSPADKHTPSLSCTAPPQKPHFNPEIAVDIQPIDNLTVIKALGTASEDSLTPADHSKGSAPGKGRRLSGPRVRRGQKKGKVTVDDSDLLSEEPQNETREKTEEPREEQTTASFEVPMGSPSKHSVPEHGEVDTEELCAQTSADNPCTDSDGKSEYHNISHASTSDGPPSGEESNNTVSPQRTAKRGRRSSVNSSVLQELQNHAEQQQTSHEVEEKGQGEQAAGQQENIQSGSDSQEEEGVANMVLAPWQADFNCEDVFRPVASRRQRSVRRSLRNQSSAEHSGNSAGLAWLPRTSPDSGKEARRRTRGRRLSAALPVQPSLQEETQDIS